MGAVLLKILNAGGLGGAISEITSMFFSFLGGKIPEKVILVIGLVLAILVGTTRQTIIAVEKGKFNPSAKLALLLAAALDVKFEDLFYF